ncbi:MAG: ComEC/Rec2 family competence protein [Bacteroidales bacterium]|jgi:competence protein ComEC|nr:ComEC/Rec2 family competence protein [Bacteroidales bacterium]MDY0085632.1 ComEC/Rec2 family competence protein [Bacteroidales bacterium]
MINFNKYPFLRLLPAFGIGIFVALKYNLTPYFAVVLTLSVVLFASFLIQTIINKSYKLRWLIGLNIVFLFIAIGTSATLINKQSQSSGNSSLITSPNGLFIARVVDTPIERDATIKATLKLIAVKTEDSLVNLNDKMLAYFQKVPEMKAIGYGDIISFSTAPATIDPPKNPGQFDYKQYLSDQNIFFQVYLKNESWFLTTYKKQNPIYALAYQLRDHLLNVLTTHQLSGEEFAVAAAILLGYDDSLPAYLRKGYVAAGAMHILCVSGLHVGIVFLFFSFLLKPLKDKGFQGLLKILILLLTIWAYALITGLSPSIQRASLMISFVLIGKLFGRKGFALNAVAASAFVLLIINPQNLMHIGFQLSYAAVFGILLLHKPIANLLYFNNKVLSISWDVTALALAAQLATTPFVLYYFHQFPVYFWLSNLFLMPLSFVVIVTGMALLCLHFLPYLAPLLGKSLSALIYLMNTGIQWIETLPHSVIKGLYINRFEFVLLVCLVLLVIFLIRKKRAIFALSAALIALFIMVSFTHRNLENSRQISLIVYDLNKTSAVDFVFGHDHILLTDSSLVNDTFTKEFFIEGNWFEKGLSSVPAFLFFDEEKFDNPFLLKRKQFIGFGEKIMLIWEKERYCRDSLSYRPKIDWVLVRGKQRENLQQMLNGYQPAMLILDGSVPYYLAKQWKETATKMDIPIHYTRDEGAYVFNFNRDNSAKSN